MTCMKLNKITFQFFTNLITTCTFTFRYRWLRGNKTILDVVTAQWTVDPVGLDSRTNFSCYAHNEGGDGNPTTILLDVLGNQ